MFILLLNTIWGGCSSLENEEKTISSKNDYRTIESYSMLSEDCLANNCSVEQCHTWYAKGKTIEDSDILALKNLCLYIEDNSDFISQQCGIPACYLLPMYDSKTAQEIVLSSRPTKSGQKMVRQALFRGYLQNPQTLSELMNLSEMKSKIDFWQGILIAEMECDETSIAHQMKLDCRERYPILAEVFWGLMSDMTLEQNIKSTMYLSLLFDRSATLQKIQSILTEEKDSEITKIALQVVYIQYMKAPKNITPQLLTTIQSTCNIDNNRNIQIGCMLWKNVF